MSNYLVVNARDQLITAFFASVGGIAWKGLRTMSEDMLCATSSRESDSAAAPKVFCIGLIRTGTTSLTRALDVLGFDVVHAPADLVTQQEIYGFYESGADALELSLLRDHDGVADTVACCLYQALDRAYPGSRFVLTVRDKRAWLDSVERLWDLMLRPLFEANADTDYAKFHAFLHTKFFGAPEFDREAFARLFDDYHAELERFFQQRQEQLLVLDIVGGEGWERLAPFLDRPIPAVPFPSENQSSRLRGVDLPGQSEGAAGDHPDHPVEEVRAYLDAFRRKDLDSCLARFSDEAVISFLGKQYTGRAAIEKWHRDRFRARIQLESIRTIEVVDGSIVVDGAISTRLLRTWRVKLDGQLVFRFREQRISHLRVAGGRLSR